MLFYHCEFATADNWSFLLLILYQSCSCRIAKPPAFTLHFTITFNLFSGFPKLLENSKFPFLQKVYSYNL